MAADNVNSDGAAVSGPWQNEAGKARRLAWISIILLIGLMLFLNYWGDLQRIGVPGVKVVRRDVRMMPDKIDEKTTLESLEVIATNAVALPAQVAGYQSIELPIQKIVHDTLPKDTVFGQRIYVGAGDIRIQNTVVLMGSDRTSIHKPEFCLEGSGFQILKAEEVKISMTKPFQYELPAMKMTIRQEKAVQGKTVVTEGVYVFWFVSGDKLTARHRDRMWWMAKDLLTKGELQRWAYVIAFGVGKPGETGRTDEIFDQVVRFIQASVPEYQLVPGPDLHGNVARR